MLIYFAHNDSIKHHKQVADMERVFGSVNAKVEHRDPKTTNLQEQQTLTKVQGVVVHGSSFDDQVGYILAYMLLAKKPLLCVMSTNQELAEVEALIPQKSMFKYLRLASLEQTEVSKIILEFLNEVRTAAEENEIPNIKFTLRITGRLEKYLQWRAKKVGATKARFLREYIESNALDKDTEYLKQEEEEKKDTSL